MVTFENEQLSKAEVADRVGDRVLTTHSLLDVVEDELYRRYPNKYKYYRERGYYRYDVVPYPYQYSDLPELCRDLWRRLLYVRTALIKLLGEIPKQWKEIIKYPRWSEHFYKPEYPETYEYYYAKRPSPREVYEKKFQELIEEQIAPSRLELEDAEKQAKRDADRKLLNLPAKGYIPMKGEERLALLLSKWSKAHEERLSEKRKKEELSESDIAFKKRWIQELAKVHNWNLGSIIRIPETPELTSWTDVEIGELYKYPKYAIEYALKKLKERNK